MVRIGALSEKYEGGGPSTISTGTGDSGGVSYGTYQLATNTGSAAAFVAWLQERGDFGRDYGNLLAKNEPGSLAFSADWLSLADTDPQGFGELQDEYVTPHYYGAAASVAEERGIDTGSLPEALQQVLFANAIQHGPQNAGELLAESYDPDPEIWIRKIYETKLTDPSWSSGAPALRPGLFSRWANEREDAIRVLHGGEV